MATERPEKERKYLPPINGWRVVWFGLLRVVNSEAVTRYELAVELERTIKDIMAAYAEVEVQPERRGEFLRYPVLPMEGASSSDRWQLEISKRQFILTHVSALKEDERPQASVCKYVHEFGSQEVSVGNDYAKQSAIIDFPPADRWIPPNKYKDMGFLLVDIVGEVEKFQSLLRVSLQKKNS
ncbi:MAG: hypothetical protein UW86_C0003G0013 [Microgenomates group bacterium GW2011_GWA1_Microgenomates_45_10]|nr:MAG: hypothetical protein UW69_C0034G0003 [Microgenomates group bacterium GW2011_GWA2_44_7]KKT77645.1 MAG: hypothetical protein UW73_C0015G0013 [Microgenomates group bacterium GW2011_GWB1_44_8]KKT87368.1 MAG: hypothetical protein UW86_C0003G0013 [Microgenomates group bacterium GW2011_GWA1_Microgenomates_45_10]